MNASVHLSPSAWERLLASFGARRLLRGSESPTVADLEPAPDGWLRPEQAHEVALALQVCGEQGVPLVVRGNGSRSGPGPLGGVRPGGFVVLDTSGLTGVEAIDASSLWARVRAGTTLAEVVRAAGEVGCRPVGMAAEPHGTLGGWLATRSRIPDAILGIDQPAVAGLEAMLPDGRLVRSVQTPRAAVGPDLFSPLLATRGAFGVILGAVIKLEPLPERQLLAGYRFASLERALGVIRHCLHGLVPPSQMQLLVDGRKGRRMARLWVCIEGKASLAGAALRGLQAAAVRAGGRPRQLERVRAWRADSAFGRQPVFEAAVRWSRLTAVLRGADRLMGGYALAVLDRMGLTGGRLRLAAPRSARGNLRPGWMRLTDPGEREAKALAQARRMMERLRAELDPRGLLNPHAWPLVWDGEAADRPRTAP